MELIFDEHDGAVGIGLRDVAESAVRQGKDLSEDVSAKDVH